MYTSDLNHVKHLAMFIINTLGENRTTYFKNGTVDFDLMAAYIWDNYTDPFNEFMINDAIDLVYEAVENL